MPLTDTVDSQSSGRDEPANAVAIRANRYDVVSRLADDVAHEIKNPLNAIVVNLEVMRRKIGNGANDVALERARVIDHEVRRVHALVEQLLQLLRPAKSETALLAIDALLESMAPAIEIQAKAARVTVQFESESDLYTRVRSEPFRFALLNLLGRAIDAEAATNGTVTIQARRAADEIYLIVKCSSAELNANDEAVEFCRLLMQQAGGTLESVELNHGAVGSTATVVMPPARLA
jgi:signal transduction histidine kinase